MSLTNANLPKMSDISKSQQIGLQGIFNCLTGGVCASPVEKIAPPMFRTYPPKFYLTFVDLSFNYIIPLQIINYYPQHW